LQNADIEGELPTRAMCFDRMVTESDRLARQYSLGHSENQAIEWMKPVGTVRRKWSGRTCSAMHNAVNRCV
jgi:hypothetical protein